MPESRLLFSSECLKFSDFNKYFFSWQSLACDPVPMSVLLSPFDEAITPVFLTVNYALLKKSVVLEYFVIWLRVLDTGISTRRFSRL